MSLDGKLLASLMSEAQPECRCACFESIDSTNLEAKRRIKSGDAMPLLIAADSQTAGRGRLGRSFESPPETGVYFSVAFRPEKGAAGAVGVTCAAAVSAMEAIRRETGLNCGIKWVNDLYLGGKKVCGILAEAVGDCVIVGVGINVTTEFSGELGERASSLGKACRREALAAWTAAGILRYASGKMPDMIEKYRQNSIVIGKEITYYSPAVPPKKATCTGIDDNGGLIVRFADGGEETLSSGEISVRMENYL